MVAISKGFRTRAQLGLRSPRSVSYNITPQNGGVAEHWNGGPTGITALTNHAKCEEHWRADQNYHMNTMGWVDIAYTGGFCQHGKCLAGRGFNVRTAANGTNDGNQNYYAYCWLGGLGETPTRDALNAFEWWVVESRRAGKAGKRVRSHNSFFNTQCAGSLLTLQARSLDDKVLTFPPVVIVTAPVVNWFDIYEKEDDMERLILALYREVLGRKTAPAISEIDGHLVGMAARGLTTKQLYTSFYNSAEAKGYRARKV